MNGTTKSRARALLFAVEFIAGMLIVAGVFLPWAMGETGYGQWRTKIKDVSGWEIAAGDVTIREITINQSALPLIALVGGFLVLVGATCGLMTRAKVSSLLVLIGGVFALVGAFGCLGDIPEAIIRPFGGGNEVVNVAYGCLVSLMGGIFSTIIGPFGHSSRTIKEIFVMGRNSQEVRDEVLQWMKDQKVKVAEEKEDFIKGRIGIPGGLGLTASKYFEISFKPAQGGVIVHTEGFISIYGITEKGFSARAIIGGIPRRKGWKVMKNLLSRLTSMSVRAKDKAPATEQTCPSCGVENKPEMEYCHRCGRKLQVPRSNKEKGRGAHLLNTGFGGLLV